MGQSAPFRIETINLDSIQRPSKILSDLMEEHDLNEAQVSDGAGISKSLVSLILAEDRRITETTALRLARFFGISPMEFINAQTLCDLLAAQKQLGEKLDNIEPISKSTRMKNRDRETAGTNIL